jgi:lipopolysaccharide transport system permease protein
MIQRPLPLSRRLLASLDPVALFRHFRRYRELTLQLIRRDLAQRYRGSFLGMLWSFVTPLATLIIYTFVFSTVLKARWRASADASPIEFALALFSGLIPFGVFSEVANRSPGLVLGSPNYVKKVVFPLDVLPVVTLGAALVHSLIGVGILLALVTWATGSVSLVHLAALPLAYLPLIFLSLAVGWLLASLGVYVRDIGNGIGIAVQLLMFLCPIVYPIEAVPPAVQHLFWFNPLTPIVESFRSLLLWHEWPNWRPWLGWTLGTGVLAWISHAWFMQLRRGFADVV